MMLSSINTPIITLVDSDNIFVAEMSTFVV